MLHGIDTATVPQIINFWDRQQHRFHLHSR